MSIFWSIFLTIYVCGFCGVWLWTLIDEADWIKDDLFQKPVLDVNDWIKFLWGTVLWPIIIIIAYFKYGFIPTIKFIYKFFGFGLKFILYPFKLIFNIKHKPNREPISDKIGKFIVKIFKL